MHHTVPREICKSVPNLKSKTVSVENSNSENLSDEIWSYSWEKLQCLWAGKSCRRHLLITSPIRHKHRDHLLSDYSESSHQKKQEHSYHIHKLYPKCWNDLKWKDKLKWIYIAQGFPKFFASDFPPTFQFPIQGSSVLCCPFICPRASLMPCILSLFLPFPFT